MSGAGSASDTCEPPRELLVWSSEVEFDSDFDSQGKATRQKLEDNETIPAANRNVSSGILTPIVGLRGGGGGGRGREGRECPLRAAPATPAGDLKSMLEWFIRMWNLALMSIPFFRRIAESDGAGDINERPIPTGKFRIEIIWKNLSLYLFLSFFLACQGCGMRLWYFEPGFRRILRWSAGATPATAAAAGRTNRQDKHGLIHFSNWLVFRFDFSGEMKWNWIGFIWWVWTWQRWKRETRRPQWGAPVWWAG